MRDFPEKLMNHLHFLGHVETEMLERYYRCCDLFVAPSLYESFGFIYIEAMSFAKPVIGCSVGGVPEVIRDGVNGKLVPPEDPAALAMEMLRLLRDEPLRRKMGRQARAGVEANFTRERMVENTLVAYGQLI